MRNRHVFPFTRFVLTLLSAAVRMGPAVTVTVLKEGGRVRSNWMLATESVPGSKVRGTSTAVPGAPEALSTISAGAAHAAEASSMANGKKQVTKGKTAHFAICLL